MIWVTMANEPQPLSTTAKGGERIANNTRRIDMMKVECSLLKTTPLFVNYS